MNKNLLDTFYTYQAGIYDWTRKLILFNHREMIDMLNISADHNVFDIACGTGKNIPFLLKYVSSEKIVGFDYSEAMLKQARKKFSNVTLVKEDCSDIHYPHQADIAVCSYSLTMIDERKKTIKSIADHLTPRGKLGIVDFGMHRKQCPMYHPLRWFLKQCHINVDIEDQLIEELKKYFHISQIKKFHSGYNIVIIAQKK